MKKFIKSLAVLIALASLTSCKDKNSSTGTGSDVTPVSSTSTGGDVTPVSSTVEHQHNFNKEVVSDDYLATQASCTTPSTYYYSCECGEKGTSTFIVGTKTDHTYENGVCTLCNQKQPSEGLEFSISPDYTSYYVISGIGSCTDTDIVIPSEFNNLPVKGIAIDAFIDNTTITNVVIPEGVTFIDRDAFNGCTSLKSVTLPSTLTSINRGAFYKCTLLENINIPDGVLNVGRDSFSYTAIKSLELPSKLKSLGRGAFSNCTSLSKVTLHEGITEIERDTFNTCSSLSEINIPEGVKSIGRDAFINCTSLKNVVFPDSLEAIERGAFYYCETLTNVVIPNKVSTIGDYAFQFCSKIRTVTIGKSVTSIGSKAFEGCEDILEVCNLSELNIKTGDSNNGNVAKNAIRVYGENEESDISKDENGFVFYDDGTNVQLIDYEGNATELTLPTDRAYEIANYAFYNIATITSVVIPSNVTSIGFWAFEYCSSLKSVTIENKNIIVESSSFNNCSIEYAKVPMMALSSVLNTSLKTLEITSGVSITEGKFNNHKCVSIEEVILPSTLINIGSYGFGNCTSLKSIKIPENVKIIDNYAFNNCNNLEYVVLPKSITNIGEYAFSSDKLTAVYFEGTKTEWDTIFSTDGNGIHENGNEKIKDETIRYYFSSTNPFLDGTVTEGNYWSYDENGNPAIWTNPNTVA